MSELPRRQLLLSAAALGLSPSLMPSLGFGGVNASAQATLLRTFGNRAKNIHLNLKPASAANWYSIESKHNQLTIEGSSPVALVRGAYSYFKSIGAANISWEGARTQIPTRLPHLQKTKIETPFAHRVYLNPCTFGYTTPFWDWARWQKEIDWMALHGIDMPLAMEGQEFVWHALWRSMGLSEEELSGYFSGPAFTPWHRMGNIEGYAAPLPQAWIEKKRRLQIKILAEMRGLGMTPILPAFGGYVPKAFAQKHPEARIIAMRPWEGFHETYWLDPTDPLFSQIAARFIELYTKTYGEGGYYLADSFNEMLPPISKDGSDIKNAKYGDSTANTKAAEVTVDPALKAERLAEYGAAIYDSIKTANPSAVWVMQGWLFGADKKFWTPDAISAFLSKVPDEKLMILDIGNDRYPGVWQSTNAFQGKPWVYGYVHNYGASNPVYGDLGFYQKDIADLKIRKDTGQIKGFGLFPEGLDNNSIVYEYAYDQAWGMPEATVESWLKTYLAGRYGYTTPALVAAWNDYQKAAYATRYWTPRWWRSAAGAYMIFKRPRIDAVEFEGHPGDHALLLKSIKALLSLKGFESSALFRNDLIDAVRHYVSIELDMTLIACLKDYQNNDLNAGDIKRRKISDIMSQLDLLLGGQQMTLATWIESARAYGDTADEKAYYVRNAKAQVTYWGGSGNLNDYASKAWQGMYKDFYLPRWTKLLAALRQSKVENTVFDQARFTKEIAAWEHAWVNSNVEFVRRKPKNEIALARDIIHQVERT